MWIITHYVGSSISMFEFETEQEAKDALKTMEGYNILSEVGCSDIPHITHEVAWFNLPLQDKLYAEMILEKVISITYSTFMWLLPKRIEFNELNSFFVSN